MDKMLSTVGQIASTYHQVSPIIQQFGSIIKTLEHKHFEADGVSNNTGQLSFSLYKFNPFYYRRSNL
ncbi:hypothetical protein CV093_03205 [Oceanobacillus sp. 143]|nr:hypothetical protein CV093_03205 [Oceanobacillus sp. 143]